jgi:CheY-like chemotaxis protein
MLPLATRQTNPIDILVADPDAICRTLYRDALTEGTEHLVEAVDGREALVKALVKPPSLVITELQLPFIDGAALCEILRQDRTTSRVPIVVVTSVTAPAEIARARRAGANAVLSKPTSRAAIRQEMNRLFAQTHDLRARAASAVRKSTAEIARTARLLEQADVALPARLSKAHQRFTTTTPPVSPPALVCPTCDEPLRYEYSHIGGVSAMHPEQWDYYACSACGTFQYRQRTRRLRRIS